VADCKNPGSIKAKFLILESATEPNFPKLSFGFYSIRDPKLNPEAGA
jgi:hypothetical protein